MATQFFVLEAQKVFDLIIAPTEVTGLYIHLVETEKDKLGLEFYREEFDGSVQPTYKKILFENEELQWAQAFSSDLIGSAVADNFIFNNEPIDAPYLSYYNRDPHSQDPSNYDFTYYTSISLDKIHNFQWGENDETKFLLISGSLINGGEGVNPDVNTAHFTLKIEGIQQRLWSGTMNKKIKLKYPFDLDRDDYLFVPPPSKLKTAKTSSSQSKQQSTEILKAAEPGTMTNVTFGIPCPPSWNPDRLT